MYKTIQIITVFLMALVVWSCFQEVNPNPSLSRADPILVVNAWLDNANRSQYISLNWTQPFFDSGNAKAVKDAVIVLTDDQGTAERRFEYKSLAGLDNLYEWRPGAADSGLGPVGTNYTLTISVNGQTYKATSQMRRVPPIDSITLTRREQNSFSPDTDEYIVTFWATDIPGKGDTYRINDNSSTIQQRVAYDAGFTRGNELDGIVFIQPIRQEILDPSYREGDFYTLELESITPEAFTFLKALEEQQDQTTQNIFSALFTSPHANLPTNVVNIDSNGKPAVGFFNVAAISSKTENFTFPE